MGLFRKKEIKNFDIIKTAEFYEDNKDFRTENFMQCPKWLEPEYDEAGHYQEIPDDLYLLFDPLIQQKFFKEGKVAAGALVQANTLLFKRGRDALPANYIYSTDPYYMENPEELAELANALFDTKGEQGYLPSIQKLADLLADEFERIYCYRLPKAITEGRDVFFTTVIVDRKHLPEKKITGGIIPFLVLAENKPDAVILPHWYWKA